METTSLEAIFANISQLSPAVRNNGGGYYNHILYWHCMAPNGGGQPSGNLAEAIDNTFGSLANFQEQFAQAAINTFGSGFVWLIVKNGELEIVSTPNQDNPLMDVASSQGEPILALDAVSYTHLTLPTNREV